MNQEFVQAAINIVTWLAPFTPFLVDAAKVGGKKFIETIATKGGELTWNKAQETWREIQDKFGNDNKIAGAILMLSSDPEDQDSQKILAKLLSKKLQSEPEFARKLIHDLQQVNSFQSIVASNNSLIQDVVQENTGEGNQLIEAKDGSIVNHIRQKTKSK